MCSRLRAKSTLGRPNATPSGESSSGSSPGRTQIASPAGITFRTLRVDVLAFVHAGGTCLKRELQAAARRLARGKLPSRWSGCRWTGRRRPARWAAGRSRRRLTGGPGRRARRGPPPNTLADCLFGGRLEVFARCFRPLAVRGFPRSPPSPPLLSPLPSRASAARPRRSPGHRLPQQRRRPPRRARVPSSFSTRSTRRSA